MGTMSLVHNRCEFADRQVIRLQETPDAVPDGQNTPYCVTQCIRRTRRRIEAWRQTHRLWYLPQRPRQSQPKPEDNEESLQDIPGCCPR